MNKSKYGRGKIAAIKKGCAVCKGILEKTAKNLDKFKTEKDASRFIDNAMNKHKLKRAFPTIVSGRRNARDIHHKPDKTKLERGFLIIDFGARIKGYCCDITRTFFLGKPNAQEKKLYRIVLGCHNACVKFAKPGRNGKEMFLFARGKLGKFGRQLKHGLGHGLGKKIHCYPGMKRKSADILRENDVITIEPGIYKKGRYGIRIEDDYLVTKKGLKKLSKIKTNLISLAKWQN